MRRNASFMTTKPPANRWGRKFFERIAENVPALHDVRTMDLTPYIQNQEQGENEDRLLTVTVTGKVALAMKGRFFLRCFCDSFQDTGCIGCAVTDEDSCIKYLEKEPFELLICTDRLEKGNGFELTRKAREQQPSLKVVVLALGDAIPVEYANASWLEAVVAEADIIEDRKPLEAAVLAVLGHHS